MNHAYVLQRAYKIANQIDPHLTSTNPRVGCVIVKDGSIIATGAHRQIGGDHAEVEAVKKLEAKNFQNWGKSDVYVTLEPCQDYPGKKTPACTDLLSRKGFRRVFFGAKDPHFSKKASTLSSPLFIYLDQPHFHKKLNPFFDDYIVRKRPYISLKIAQSLDGKWEAPTEKWISNQASRRRVHQMRAEYQAILTTIQTITADQARLDCRLEKYHRAYSDPEIVVLGSGPIPEFFEKENRRVLAFNKLDDWISSEKWGDIQSIMTECGPTLATVLLHRKYVDEIQIFIAPKVFGSAYGWGNSSHDPISNNDQAYLLKGFYTAEVEELSGDLLWTLKKYKK